MIREYRNEVILSVLGIICLLLVAIGVTYAVFSYDELGGTTNILTTGSLKIRYTEGKGMNMVSSFPVSDSIGMKGNEYFDFKVEGSSSGSVAIPYVVTLAKTVDSNLPDYAVKIFLTDDLDRTLLHPVLFNRLEERINKDGIAEKVIFRGKIDEGNLEYLKEFKFRFWVDENIDFNGTLVNGIMTYPYSDKTFKLNINVYAETIIN